MSPFYWALCVLIFRFPIRVLNYQCGFLRTLGAETRRFSGNLGPRAPFSSEKITFWLDQASNITGLYSIGGISLLFKVMRWSRKVTRGAFLAGIPFRIVNLMNKKKE